MAIFDPGRLNGLPPSKVHGAGFRHQAPGFDPRSGEGARRAGGRFNPPRSFPAVYLCTTRSCVVAERTAQANRQSVNVEDLLPRELWSVTLILELVLDLTDSQVLDTTGLVAPDLVQPDHGFTRLIGEAAHERGYQAIRSFSATGVDEVLVLFPAHVDHTAVEVELVARWESDDAPR